jgi:hypothetical protein
MSFRTKLDCLSLASFPAYSNKHSSLVRKLINYVQKSFITLTPRLRVIKLFTAYKRLQKACVCPLQALPA